MGISSKRKSISKSRRDNNLINSIYLRYNNDLSETITIQIMSLSPKIIMHIH